MVQEIMSSVTQSPHWPHLSRVAEFGSWCGTGTSPDPTLTRTPFQPKFLLYLSMFPFVSVDLSANSQVLDSAQLKSVGSHQVPSVLTWVRTMTPWINTMVLKCEDWGMDAYFNTINVGSVWGCAYNPRRQSHVFPQLDRQAKSVYSGFREKPCPGK